MGKESEINKVRSYPIESLKKATLSNDFHFI